MASKTRQSLAIPDLQFDDPRLKRLMQFVRAQATEVQRLQQLLAGGSAGQVLLKTQTADYVGGWGDESGGAVTGATNEGAGRELFISLSGGLLGFRSLIQGANISLLQDSTSITIAAAGGGSGTGTVTSVGINSADLDVLGSPVTVAGSIELEIKENAVTYAKMQPTSTDSLLIGRRSGEGPGSLEELGASDVRALLGGVGYAPQLAFAGIV